jgi:hypothetical protein
MGLDELNADVKDAYSSLDDTIDVTLDQETKHELAMLSVVLDQPPNELLTRGIHVLFQATIDTAKIDFHLRREYDVTYDEFLSGMTFEDMTGGWALPQPDDDRRYNF